MDRWLKIVIAAAIVTGAATWTSAGIVVSKLAGRNIRLVSACDRIDELIAAKDPSAIDDPLPADHPLFLALPGDIEGYTLKYDYELDRARAAETRVDPAEGLVSLGRHGFVRGYRRDWNAEPESQFPRTAIFAFVYEFGEEQSALDFDNYANRYACPFANEAFTVDALPGSLGLQVRDDDGIEEQVSFVLGPRRFVIGMDALAGVRIERRYLIDLVVLARQLLEDVATGRVTPLP